MFIKHLPSIWIIAVALVMKHTNSYQRSQGNAVVLPPTHTHPHTHTHTNVHMKVVSRNQAKAGAYVPGLKIEKYLKH